MRAVVVTLAALMLVACNPLSGPERDDWDYVRKSDTGEILARGTLHFTVPSVAEDFRGTWEAGGESGDLRGTYPGRKVHFLVIGTDDTLRHVAFKGDTLDGYWTNGVVKDGDWVQGDRIGVFTAIKNGHTGNNPL